MDKTAIFPLIVMGLLFSTAIYLSQKRKGDIRKNILNNIEYSKGTVVKYVDGHEGIIGTYAKISPSDPYIKIVFKSKEHEIKTESKGFLFSDKEGCVGKNFVVVYDSTNPETCILLFDYPINDSTDFARYIDEFKTNPPYLGK